jgi:hypothetical protein
LKQQQVMLANDMSTGYVSSDIRVIDRVTAQNNVLYFLLLQWLCKDVTLLCSSLTIDPRPYNYTLRTNDRNIECAVGRLTSGIRRRTSRTQTCGTATPWGRRGAT